MKLYRPKLSFDWLACIEPRFPDGSNCISIWINGHEETHYYAILLTERYNVRLDINFFHYPYSFQHLQNIQKHFETSSQVKVPQEEISANTTKTQSFELTVDTNESSTIHARTETSVGNLVDEKYFSNVSQVKSMRMIEIPKPKKMLLPVFDIDATNDYDKSAKDDFALKKIIKTLQEETKSFSTQNDESITVDPTHLVPDTIDDSSKQFPLQSIPIPSSDSKLNTENISRSRSNDNEDTNTSVRSRLRLADGSIPGIVKVRMQNTSIIEDGAMRLIYSVHLDDKPVPAKTAARDMALLSPQEVALELGAPVIVQSERK